MPQIIKFATFEIRDLIDYVFKLSSWRDDSSFGSGISIFFFSWNNISFVFYIRSGKYQESLFKKS